MAQSDKEKRDMKIALIVAGVIVILLLLWTWLGGNAALLASTQNPLAQPTVDGSGTPGASDYNYNIAPYNPGTPIQYAFPTMAASNENGACCGDSGGPQCGPVTGADLNALTTSQYLTLAG